jgi:hypothetical protein
MNSPNRLHLIHSATTHVSLLGLRVCQLMTRAIRIKCPKREAGVAKNARPANALLNHLGIVLHLDLLFVSRRLAWPMKKNTIMWIERWRF